MRIVALVVCLALVLGGSGRAATSLEFGYDAKGRPVVRQRFRPPNRALWLSGLALMATSTIVMCAVASQFNHDSEDRTTIALLPLLPSSGPLVSALFDGDYGHKTLFTIGSIAQSAGLYMIVHGAIGDEKVTTVPIFSVSPGAVTVGLAGRF